MQQDMPGLNGGRPASAGDEVVRFRFVPVLFWAIGLAAVAFAALVSVGIARPDPGAPAMAWGDWLALAVIWAVAAFFASALVLRPITRLALGADGSVRLATRTPFAATERRLEPGSLSRVELRRNHFGPLFGWQLVLRWADGRSLVLNERADAAAQAALAGEIARRLGIGEPR
jgi:hypothetical protein